MSQAGAMARVLGGGTGQSVLRSGGGDDEDEIEEVRTTAFPLLQRLGRRYGKADEERRNYG